MTNTTTTQPALPEPIVTVRMDRVVADSRDVADYFGKPHSNVLRAIDDIIEKTPEWGSNNFDQTLYTHAQNGQQYRYYEMRKDAFTVLVMGFTGAKAMEFKLAYLQRFNEMEAALKETEQAPAYSIPQTFGEALRLAANQADTINEMAPKAHFFDTFVEAKGLMTMTEVGKPLGMSAQTLNAMLEARGVFDKRTLNRKGKRQRIPRQEYIEAGYFSGKDFVNEDNNNYVGVNFKVTPKGAQWIQGQLSQFALN